MVFNNKKQGQAAIEFLMTYGWMLLVVLIVGALIFSFVDFGNLLPNKVELNNNVRAASAESYARFTSGSASTTSHVVVTFTYSGADRITVNPADAESKIATDLDGDCDLVWVINSDTNEVSSFFGGASPGIPEAFTGLGAIVGSSTEATGGAVNFISGQTGVAIYSCSNAVAGFYLASGYNLNGGFRENDVLEGKITLVIRNAKTTVPNPSSGTIRLSIVN